MKMYKTMAVSAVALVATTANAGSYRAADYMVPTMTYTTVEQAQTSVTSGYSGVGSIFVTTQSSAATQQGYLCTASLVNSTTLVTAAHCIFDYSETGEADPVVGITFYAPSFGERSSPTVETFAASDWEYNPLYDTADHTGDIGSGHDLAMITLGTSAVGHDTYEFFTGNPLQQFVEVGTGTIGGPRGTNQGIASDYLKRTGTNIYELYGSDVFSDVTDGVVLADFDDGTAAHDVFGRNQGVLGLTGLNQLGVAGESDSSPGDSGGPSFINGQIAAVTSFGITGGVFQGYCGGNSTDPYNSSGTTAQRSLGQCTNSSVGEIMGNTLTAYNLDFINAYLAAHPSVAPAVPEPASWAMMIGGFGLVGGTARRRRRSTVTYAV
jgi:hypothetical protein